MYVLHSEKDALFDFEFKVATKHHTHKVYNDYSCGCSN